MHTKILHNRNYDIYTKTYKRVWNFKCNTATDTFANTIKDINLGIVEHAQVTCAYTLPIL